MLIKHDYIGGCRQQARLRRSGDGAHRAERHPGPADRGHGIGSSVEVCVWRSGSRSRRRRSRRRKKEEQQGHCWRRARTRKM
ncbi:hypothetical protein AG1IA_06485 [Rhizoctonia solani AG-1 IA]|uniref:Uncharacterized protein n=1 Tax=Thanatephorus cucumeris (strain AG1-IA) TaxID=983506 RepID=L8WNC8_THACA|nr:hypothetical protein AG1IA_06485 [Rhizoctonia solani AG-1 IA]